MDNLTHTLTGLLLSRAGLGKLAPRATLILVMAVNAPDIDIVTSLGGAHTYLHYHRHYTHGLPMLPLLAILPVLLAGLVRRPAKFSFVKGWLVSMAGILTHVLLDWTNIYGIRLWSPASEQWLRLDITSVVDLWIWALLLLAVLWPLLSRMVNSEIGAPVKAGPGLARAALIAVLLYSGARYFLHERAVETLNSHLYEGQTPLRVFALPHFANPFQWRGLVELDQAWVLTSVDLQRDYDPSSGRAYFQAPSSPAVHAAREHEVFRAARDFSSSLLWQEMISPEPGAGYEVTATDLRFALPQDGRFQARARVSSTGKVEEAEFRFRAPGGLPRPR